MLIPVPGVLNTLAICAAERKPLMPTWGLDMLAIVVTLLCFAALIALTIGCDRL